MAVGPRATLGAPLGILRFSHLMREEQMPAQRLAMRQVYEVWRLKWGQGLSERKIAQSLGISRPAVAVSQEEAKNFFSS